MMKGMKHITRITFMFKQIHPSYPSTIINKTDKPFFSIMCIVGQGPKHLCGLLKKENVFFYCLKKTHHDDFLPLHKF